MTSITALPNASVPTKITLSNVGRSPAQPHTNPITNLASTPNTISTGSLLALNDNYIVYAVKNGLVRVMDRSSSLRTLLRGHKERISDIGFFGSSSDVLASVSSSDCRVWRVFGREDELSSEILLEIQKDASSNGDLERVIWHPFNPNQFILLHKGSSVATFVETTRLMTTTSTEDGQKHAVSQMKGDSNVDGMLSFFVTDAQSDDYGINDLTWSNQDARHVLSAHNDGYVRLWDLRSTVFISNGKEVDPATADISSCSVSAKCLMSVKVSGDAGAQKCFFLPAFEDACAMFRSGGNTAMEAGACMTSPFVSISTSGEVTLWSPFTTSGSPPSIVSVFQLDSSSPVPSNVSICALPPVDEDTAPSAFLLMSDLEGNIHALHLASQIRDVPSSAAASSRKIAAVNGFDYAVYFKSLQPIYSQSVIVSIDESSDVKQWNLDLYCVQSKAVQKLTLSPSMCNAPTPIESGAIVDGIIVDRILDNASSAVGISDANDADFQDYEDLEDVEESVEEDVEDEQKSPEVLSLAANDVPPPPMPGLLGGENVSGAFSNWLGNLAGITKKVENVLPSARADLDLSSVPLPEAPDVDTRAAEAPSKPATPELLSPMEILGMHVKKEENLRLPKCTQEKDKEVKEKKVTKVIEKKSKPVPQSEDKKITILKREEPGAPKTFPSEIDPPASTGIGVTKEEVEEIIRKAVSSHFQKQESVITSEIQKAVRYEVQSGLVPALNKTVAQTLEQTVAKAMKGSVTKTVKEAIKANTTELASSISSKLQDPIVNSFHQTMREVMVPAYENGTRQMFQQISTSVDASLELKQKDRDETAIIMDGMVKRMDAMGKTMEVLIKAVAQLQTGAPPPVKPLPNNPEPSAADKLEKLRRKIVELLRANEFEKAFTQALSVSNSAMALFVCKHSDLSVVLESDTPNLSHPIMLCLMQQLGADLTTDDDLNIKLAWLQSMALTLDPQNESISKHIRGVVQQLVVNLQAKMATSDPALRRHLQMLLQVIRGIGNS